MTASDAARARRESAVTDVLERVRQEVGRLPERPATAEEFWCLVWDQTPETLDFEQQPIDEAQRCALRIGALCVAWLLK